MRLALRLASLALVSVPLLSLGCRNRRTDAPAPSVAVSAEGALGAPRLADARRGFVTHLVARADSAARSAPPPPPPALFDLVRYPSPAGALAAYVTPRPANGAKRPAVIWIQGGFDSSIDALSWSPASPENDQSGRAFREAGLVLMVPSLRGGNDNPGRRETLYGEVDDVIAAGDFAAKLDYVDPSRVYLVGHSTGGTLVLLVAESTDRFRAVFAFGAVGNAKSYAESATFDADDASEVRLRSPMFFADAIRTPTFIFEGAEPPSNAGALPYLKPKGAGVPVQTFEVKGVSHFSILAPVTRLLAAKIGADSGPRPHLAITDAELEAAVARGSR